MEVVLLVAVLLLGAIIWFGFSRLTARLDQQGEAFRSGLEGLRGETHRTLTAQIGQVVQSFNQQLGQVRSALQQGLADAGTLASQAQETVGQRLAEAAQVVADVSRQLGGLQEAGRELKLSAQTLESVLSGARTRGSLGEVALEQLLADTLPQEAFESQYRFTSGAAVDAAVKLGEKILSIDSKFPLDSYRRLSQATDPASEEQARKEFAGAVRGHVDAIADKYILPAENTLEVAFMFLASEGVYYELLRTEDGKGSLAEYCRARRVFPVSPNTLYAYLAIILMGLRGLQVEENARRLLSALTGLQGDLQSFNDVYARLGTHLKNASQSYADAAPKLERLERSLASLAHGRLPEADADLTPLTPASNDK